MKFAMLAGAVFAGFAAAQNSLSGGIVEATVVNSATGICIGGAAVVFSGNQSARYEATTDAAGHFQITVAIPRSPEVC
jgi:hypothetical protein